MKETSSGTGRRANRLRAMLWSIVLIAVAAMVLPLTAYVWTAAVQAQETSQEAGQNPRSEYWRDVRGAGQGYTAVRGQETDVLIQSGGQTWREARNGPVTVIGAILVLGVIAAVLLYHLTKGGFKLEHRTGRKVFRWAVSDRVLHWYTAILFIILAITGLSLLWGRYVLIPVLGKEGFAAWANLAKPVHDYLALFFTAGLVVMLLKWMKHNLFKGYDLQWILQGGGYLPNGKHPKAGFCNAGEKLFYWTLFFMGAAMVISGVFLLFPNYGFQRETMQLANVVHGFSSLFVIAFVCLHIYLATLGSPGAFRGMTTGKVDAVWAAQHHSEWYKDVTGDRSAGHAPGGAHPSPSPAARMP